MKISFCSNIWHKCPKFGTTIAYSFQTIFDSVLSQVCNHHCVKNVQILSFFWSEVSCVWTEYGDLWSHSHIQSEYRKIRTRKKLRIWTFFTQCNILGRKGFLEYDHFNKQIVMEEGPAWKKFGVFSERYSLNSILNEKCNP